MASDCAAYQAVAERRPGSKCGRGRLRGIPRLTLGAKVSRMLAKRRATVEVAASLAAACGLPVNQLPVFPQPVDCASRG